MVIILFPVFFLHPTAIEIAFSRCLFTSRAESLCWASLFSVNLFVLISFIHQAEVQDFSVSVSKWLQYNIWRFVGYCIITRSWMNQCRRSEQSDSSEVSGFVQSVCYKICKTCSVWIQPNIVSLTVPSYLFISEQFMTSVLCNRFTCSCSRIAPCSLVNFCSNSFRSWWEDESRSLTNHKSAI